MKHDFAPKRMMKRNLSRFSVLLIAAILIAGTASSLVAPGMVPGSPGLESPQAKKYQILKVDDEGLVSVYATREGSPGLGRLY